MCTCIYKDKPTSTKLPFKTIQLSRCIWWICRQIFFGVGIWNQERCLERTTQPFHGIFAFPPLPLQSTQYKTRKWLHRSKGGSTVTLERQVFHGRLWIPSWPTHSAAQHRRAASRKATHAAGEPKAYKGIIQFSEKRIFEVAMFHCNYTSAVSGRHDVLHSWLR